MLLYNLLFLLAPLQVSVSAFGVLPLLKESSTLPVSPNHPNYSTRTGIHSNSALSQSANDDGTFNVMLDPTLDEDRVTSLFAWLSRAFAGEDSYNNLMLGMAAIFGTNLPLDSEPIQMVERANKMIPLEEECTGALIPRYQREEASLGAMGAGQWLGQYKTRPHSLLDVRNMTNIDEDWVKHLPRGCRRTLKKALAQNFTVASKNIVEDEPAPHSSLAHFRCVIEHEVRLIAWGDGDVQSFFQALSEGVSRYQGTTRMTGVIQEYRNDNNKVIAFAHEVRKGGTVRGQWFYGDDEASKSYVWFHSVYKLVERAIEAEGVDVVDLGPSGSDAFTDLKAKYGFVSVDDWPAQADYTGPFYYEGEQNDENGNDAGRRLRDLLRMLGR
uniref:BioF2-like acetyltransferase domain-containing protein n=1 Tax=Chaetoceros debilis TaxID=122233 RepID=A0A7S3QJT1_9STRA|mmetsp:Transcript_22090/g.33582  ORF Transcript_22090/g.33582 Transcript_22090/m.33582 type:complete len:384 (-) Transcript_22090:269-1420(-)|eukprot:CAMPEP_0194114994 /NCGR_PEP_ID=MMETSP0150-20130528/22109_1 /TAXON_ID=122233 /ORGANISM="Chaetoceros debilis, Strain MM31A-1" /LENGTH=383 /DNA_ID=CAMNT_0038805363 /DNA_START=49 /DNA_END=1200 /DNA_ORIENTATION=-